MKNWQAVHSFSLHKVFTNNAIFVFVSASLAPQLAFSVADSRILCSNSGSSHIIVIEFFINFSFSSTELGLSPRARETTVLHLIILRSSHIVVPPDSENETSRECSRVTLPRHNLSNTLKPMNEIRQDVFNCYCLYIQMLAYSQRFKYYLHFI